jgi:polysaccharide export outer membrane protein
LIRAVVTAVLLLAGACAGHQAPYVWVQDLPASSGSDPVIQPRDTIVVEVAEQPTMSGEFSVRDDGHYLQPMAGSIRVAGLTPIQAGGVVAASLKRMVVDPRVSVYLLKPAPIRVSVVGEVKAPGSYEMTRDRSVTAALAAAGWVSDFAHADRIYVVRGDDQQSRVRFRLKDLTAPEPRSAQFRLRDGDVVLVE